MQVLYSRVRTFRGFQDMFFQSLTPHIFWYSFVKANSQVRGRDPELGMLHQSRAHPASPVPSVCAVYSSI